MSLTLKPACLRSSHRVPTMWITSVQKFNSVIKFSSAAPHNHLCGEGGHWAILNVSIIPSSVGPHSVNKAIHSVISLHLSLSVCVNRKGVECTHACTYTAKQTLLEYSVWVCSVSLIFGRPHKAKIPLQPFSGWIECEGMMLIQSITVGGGGEWLTHSTALCVDVSFSMAGEWWRCNSVNPPIPFSPFVA